MKKVFLLLPFLSLFSCSDSDPMVQEICDCVAPLVELQNNEELKELEIWVASLDTDDKLFLNVGFGAHSEDYDMTKHQAYIGYIQEVNKLNNKIQSCAQGIVDNYDLGDDGISKESRIKLREKCPEAAEMMGI